MRKTTTVDYSPDEWQLSTPQGRINFRPGEPGLCVNDMEAMAVALRAGAGIGLIAGFAVVEDIRAGRLVRVLPEYHTDERNVYALYASRQYADAKIKRFVDVLKGEVGEALAEHGRYLSLA